MQNPPANLRIACLLPSATDICIALGLSSNIVGITHECNLEALRQARPQGEPIRILTKNALTVTAQGDIHKAVSENWARSQNSITLDSVPSLYPIVSSEWDLASPNVVVTQDLCAVCAPSTQNVLRLVEDDSEVKIVALTPKSLKDVADSFVKVASVCAIPERGNQVRDQFLDDLQRLQETIELSRDKDQPKPTLMLLEWLDPPFDGGHWIPHMLDLAGVQPAHSKETEKSQQITWETVTDADPDVIVIACCGFKLDRNIQDAIEARKHLSPLRAFSERSIYASDGDTYFARPGPDLLGGTAILARCAYQHQPKVLQAIEELSSCSGSSIGRSQSGWQQVLFPDDNVNDMEDIASQDFSVLHDQACAAGDLTYIDPETGYSVFTEVAHKHRGRCCGSGCRHCPYAHENVRDKAKRIQQPAFLHKGQSQLFSLEGHGRIKVLFDSGGKDSFLTIRAMVRQYKETPFGLVLLTTFDAQSRIIAHQDVHVDDVVRQAQHLDISLLGVPMHRGSHETYVNRIRRALQVIEMHCGDTASIGALVFGDLHLEHIKGWRDKELGKLGIPLEYPLFQVPYSELMEDLTKSQVKCVLTSVTREGLNVGTVFDHTFCDELPNDIDSFGEEGEFHTIAQVWETDRLVALGLAGDSLNPHSFVPI